MIKQRTIKNTVEIEGIGLQTGKPVRLRLKSSPANSGINFIRADLPNKPLLNIQSIVLDSNVSKERRTALGRGALQVQTTEHLLAALAGLSIDNIVVELNNEELPALDGSAKDFVALLRKAGIAEQTAPRKIIKTDKPVWCENKDAFLALLPSDELRISYTLSYDDPSIGTQFFDIVVNEKNFEREVAPARTFCRKAEALMLLATGFGKGADHKNTLIMGKKGPFRNRLRFPNEPVRHKTLDLIGDLYLLGAAVQGHVIAVKSGHALNMELVKKLKNIL